jgi:hypothetical protein
MSNDLIKDEAEFIRNTATDIETGEPLDDDQHCNLYAIDAHRIADRIEQLERERSEWQASWQEVLTAGYAMKARAEAAEAKLAKAVEAFDMLVRDCEADYPPSHGAIKHFAIATLAEIKGGNDAESNL